MRGLFLDGGRVALRDDLPEPEGSDETTLVATRRAGVCATDLALARGYMGFRGVPGHEFVGTALDGPLAGQRVVGEINAACGNCARCRAGAGRHCATRTVLGILNHGGAFAERLRLPHANLHPVPDSVSDIAATFTEPVAAAFEIIEQLDPAAGTNCLVAGDGKLGLLCAWVLHLHGLNVTVAGRHSERRALLPDSVQFVTRALEPDSPAIGQAFGLAVEATGNPDVLPRLISAVEPRGTVVLKTTTERPTNLDLAPLVVDEITLVGSRCGPFEPALAALGRGDIPVERLVEGDYALDRGVEAFDRAAASGVLKVVIRVD